MASPHSSGSTAITPQAEETLDSPHERRRSSSLVFDSSWKRSADHYRPEMDRYRPGMGNSGKVHIDGYTPAQSIKSVEQYIVTPSYIPAPKLPNRTVNVDDFDFSKVPKGPRAKTSLTNPEAEETEYAPDDEPNELDLRLAHVCLNLYHVESSTCTNWDYEFIHHMLRAFAAQGYRIEKIGKVFWKLKRCWLFFKVKSVPAGQTQIWRLQGACNRIHSFRHEYQIHVEESPQNRGASSRGISQLPTEQEPSFDGNHSSLASPASMSGTLPSKDYRTIMTSPTTAENGSLSDYLEAAPLEMNQEQQPAFTTLPVFSNADAPKETIEQGDSPQSTLSDHASVQPASTRPASNMNNHRTASIHGTYQDFLATSPSRALSDISSIRSAGDLQCSKCKGVANGINPLVNCSNCKRLYHDSCKNLMNLLAPRGTPWQCQHCMKKRQKKVQESGSGKFVTTPLVSTKSRLSQALYHSQNMGLPAPNGFVAFAMGTNGQLQPETPGEKKRRSIACGDCRRDKCRCVHNEHGDIDTAKKNEPTIPRGFAKLEPKPWSLSVTSNPRRIIPGENAFASRISVPYFNESTSGQSEHRAVSGLVMGSCSDEGDNSDVSMEMSEDGANFVSSTPRLAFEGKTQTVTNEPNFVAQTVIVTAANARSRSFDGRESFQVSADLYTPLAPVMKQGQSPLPHIREQAVDPNLEMALGPNTNSDAQIGRPTIRKCIVCQKKPLLGAAVVCASCADSERREAVARSEPLEVMETPIPIMDAQTAPSPKVNDNLCKTENIMVGSKSLAWMFQKNPHRDHIRKIAGPSERYLARPVAQESALNNEVIEETLVASETRKEADGSSANASRTNTPVSARGTNDVRTTDPGPKSPTSANEVKDGARNDGLGPQDEHDGSEASLRAMDLESTARNSAEVAFSTSSDATEPEDWTALPKKSQEQSLTENGTTEHKDQTTTPTNDQASTQHPQASSRAQQGTDDSRASSPPLSSLSERSSVLSELDAMPIGTMMGGMPPLPNDEFIDTAADERNNKSDTYFTLSESIILALNRDPKQKSAREISEWIMDNVPGAQKARTLAQWLNSISASCSMGSKNSPVWLNKHEEPIIGTRPQRPRCKYSLKHTDKITAKSRKVEKDFQAVSPRSTKPNDPEKCVSTMESDETTKSDGEPSSGAATASKDTISTEEALHNTPKSPRKRTSTFPSVDRGSDSDGNDSEPLAKRVRLTSGVARKSAPSRRDPAIVKPQKQAQKEKPDEVETSTPSNNHTAQNSVIRLKINVNDTSKISSACKSIQSPKNPIVSESESDAEDYGDFTQADTFLNSGLYTRPSVAARREQKSTYDNDMAFLNSGPLGQVKDGWMDFVDVFKTGDYDLGPDPPSKDLFADYPEYDPVNKLRLENKLGKSKGRSLPTRSRSFRVISKPNTKFTAPPKPACGSENNDYTDASFMNSILKITECASVEEALGIPEIAVASLDKNKNLIWRDGGENIGRGRKRLVLPSGTPPPI